MPELELDDAEDEEDEEEDEGPPTVEGGLSPPQLTAEAKPRERTDTKNEYERVRLVMLLLHQSRCTSPVRVSFFLLLSVLCDFDPQ